MDRYGCWLLVLVGALMLLPGSADMPLLDRDEPRFSQATWEMMERSEWVVPYFNGEYRFDKPPLTYWWMRVHYWILGKSELGARLHSMFATMLVAFGMVAFAARLKRKPLGWVAAFGWLTCMQVFLHGRLALADMPMVAAIFFANRAWFELLFPEDGKERSRLWFWVLYVSLGLGFLAKGPLGIVVPMLSLLLFRFAFWRKPLTWRSLKIWTGLPVTFAMIAAWGIPALISTDGLFWDIGMGKHVIERGVEAFNDRKVLPFYYLLTALFSLFPWFALLGERFRWVRRDWEATSAFLVSWIVAPYLVFLGYSTQLPHYVLPAFPAMFLWVLHVWQPVYVDKGVSRTGLVWFWSYVGIWVTAAVAGLVWVLGSGLAVDSLRIGMALLFGILLCMSGIVVCFRFRKWVPMFLCVLGIAVSQWVLGIHMRELSVSIPVSEQLEGLPKETRLVGVGYAEPSLVFYSGRKWEFGLESIDKRAAEIRASHEKGTDNGLLSQEDRMRQMIREELTKELQSDQAKQTVYVLLDHEYLVDQMITEAWGGKPAQKRKELGLDVPALCGDTHSVTSVIGLNFARSRWSKVWVCIPKGLSSENQCLSPDI